LVFFFFVSDDLLLDPLYSPQTIQIGNHPDSPIHNVRQVLEANPEENPPIYTEMLDLDRNNKSGRHWKQVARYRCFTCLLFSWIKYEQSVEGDGTRFSKPHVTLLSVLGLIQLKNCLRKGIILLDVEAQSCTEIAEKLCAAWVDRGLVEAENAVAVKDLLRCPKYHLVGKHMRPSAEIEKDAGCMWWIKYEQSVEGDGTRFSKPHVTLLSVLGLIQLKNCLRKGIILLDVEAQSCTEIAEKLCAAWVDRGLVEAENAVAVKDLLRCPKYHLVGKHMRPSAEIEKGCSFMNFFEFFFYVFMQMQDACG
uniref:Photolyase/cryptochrome alpha/beta domain-containing protein n=1 Tax=Gongylonema pulchrum TaxID=637853 RepID=A0A183EC09_9BILA